MNARVSFEPTSGMCASLGEAGTGHGAYMVLVPVGQHDRFDLVEAVPDPGEVRQDHIDAGLVILREQDDDEQPAGMLEDGHVAPDLPEPAAEQVEGLPGEWRGAELGMRMAHVVGPLVGVAERWS